MTPGRFPAKVIVAPNSPRARAHAKIVPASSAGPMRGSVMRRRIVHLLAPSVAAASSKRGSALRRAPSTVMTRKGMATNASAMITPAVLKGSCTPNQS